jgi:DNA-binding transcriptional LysR family regulator
LIESLHHSRWLYSQHSSFYILYNLLVISVPKADLARRLTLRELRLFVATVRAGSIVKAANEAGVTQPALSKAIAGLEATLGARLFDRTNRGVLPTPHGDALYRRATGVFEELRNAAQEIESLADANSGELRLGAVPTICAGFLPAVMSRLLELRPQYRLDIAELDTQKLRSELLTRAVDFALGASHGAAGTADLVFEKLFEDRLFVISNVNHPLAARRSLRLGDLARFRWILPGGDSQVRIRLEEAFSEAEVAFPEVAVTSMSTSIRSILPLHTPFLTVLYGSVLRLGATTSRVRVLPVDVGPTIPIGIVRLKDRTLSPSADMFFKCAHEVAKTLRTLSAAELNRAQANNL